MRDLIGIEARRRALISRLFGKSYMVPATSRRSDREDGAGALLRCEHAVFASASGRREAKSNPRLYADRSSDC